VNRQRCLDFMADLERRDPARLSRWFTDTSTLSIPPRPAVQGARRIQALFRAIFRLYADIHWRVTEVHELDARRCVYFSESWGTLQGGGPYANQIATLIEFDEAGHIASLSDYFKDTAVFGGRG
jgi:ketosteroid isomerase-like protein